jgi:hypothetical protein
LNKVITSTIPIIIALVTATIVLGAVQMQQAQAKSFISQTGDGYDAGKAAAMAGQPEICPDKGTAYCTGFHAGWNAAKLGQHLTAP